MRWYCAQIGFEAALWLPDCMRDVQDNDFATPLEVRFV
jgi:hypothetical protein